ncbi:MAG: cyclomaltodextrinase [Cognaticolwellia sp.]|jgi:cyclomaltodextrinase
MKSLFSIKIILVTILSLFVLASCQYFIDKTSEEVTETIELSAVPEWSKNVIWYQIFVERFRNGDPTNDPNRKDIVGNFMDSIPENWKITPWTQDWYKPDAYFEALNGKKSLAGYPMDNFGSKAQLRRYGGDLQGVLDKIDYLQDLGVTAIYFNPLNDAPSLHKYDARHWRHIDRNFGNNPKEDIAIIATEVPNDPSTWQFTNADKLFLEVIKAFHKRGIRVILDYSWNHTGKEFWAFKDVQAKGEKSAFKDWYVIEKYDDINTTENEFSYQGWAGVPSLPEIKETVEHDNSIVKAYDGDLYNEAVRQHIFNISKRWLDPNGDGNPEDGVDGFRLDVAGEIGLDFWKAYRKEVRSVNPDAYLLGEIWWEKWPDKLINPKPFLEGDVFDAVMNYRWYRATRHFFNESPNKIRVSAFVDSLESFRSDLREASTYAMMNLTASHDVPRFSTSIFNKNQYKVGTNPSGENDYKIHKPDATTYEIMKLILVQQFTYIGSPHIWAGDEMGMWGADDPNCRKPLIWKDLDFESETYHQINNFKRPVDEVKFNDNLFDFYKKLIRIRKENYILVNGNIEYLTVDNENEILAYSRFNKKEEVITVFNTSNEAKTIEIIKKGKKDYKDILNNEKVTNNGNKISLTLRAKSSVILR